MMRNLIGPRIQMKFPVKFYVLCFFFSVFFEKNSAEEHLKIWKRSNNIFNRDNWVDPDLKQDCRQVEFGETNTADIYIQHLAAEDYELPVNGELAFLEGSSLKVVDHKSKMKTNCLKLKELNLHNFLNPKNWESDVADNPAVPDREKLPCRDDRIKIPQETDFSMMFTTSMGDYLVSQIMVGNVTAIKSTTIDLGDSRLLIYGRQCHSPSGCVCNDKTDIECDPAEEPQCEHPVHPEGFCHPICGAFTTFKPINGFSLKKVQESLKDYSGVFTHVSKIDDDVIQMVFAEKEYSEDSVVYAEEFFEKLKKGSAEFKITDLKELKKSGSRTSGGGSSFFSVLLSSLLFVLGLFALIFCVYGDRRWLTNLRFRNSTTFPLTSTYRARFSSRDDESGLIDTHSVAGSVLNLRQSFDNPMFEEVSTPKEETEEEKIDTTEVKAQKDKPTERNDPLFDLKKLNEELQEEIGSDVVENLQDVINSKAVLVNDFPPLIEVDESNED